MSNFLQDYIVLSASSPRSQVSGVLQRITDASPSQIRGRKELVQTILDDLTQCSKDGKGRLTAKEASPAFLAVKTLGKELAGSDVIASPANLSTLIALSRAFKDDADASNEALRCVANALLLVQDARNTFISKEVNGGEAAVELLQKSTSPERTFLASRILFLSTVSISNAGQFIRTIVEAKQPGSSGNIVEIIGTKLDALTRNILTSTKLAREAMTDLLKFTFNLLLHYPKLVDEGEGSPESKVMGECWSDKLDGILPPLLRAFVTLPPTFPSPLTPPLTHVIHALITIPVTPSLQSKWFPRGSSSPPARGSPRSSTSKGNSPSGSPSQSPSSGSPTLGPSRDSRGAFDRALSAAMTAGRRLSRATSPGPAADVLLRVHDLLDIALAHFLPGAVDPDDESVRTRVRSETQASLDDTLLPLVVLTTKLCTADDGARVRFREWLLPEDLDRTSPLEGRADLLGRCLRLLACAYHQKLKSGVGEMLFAICDSDASVLASYVGYGNVAGFLFHKGITGAPPPRSTGASGPLAGPGGVAINPITGTVEQPHELPEMTDEEKEQEAEKLFVLFDRLEKSGALPRDQNPIRRAVQEGRLG